MCKQTRTKDHTICDIELGNNPNVVLPLNSGDILNIMMATETIDKGLGVEAIAPVANLQFQV